MPVRTLAFLYAGAVATSHYEKPPCQADEIAGQLGSGALLCAPKCIGAAQTCPTDVPHGATATPQCVLKTTSGDEYCGLVCKGDEECPTGGRCTKPMPSMPTGICTYASGLQAEPLPPANSPQGLFQEFAAAVGRIYTSEEERAKRFQIFIGNLVDIEKMQALDASAIYTHKSIFADWTVEEFSARNSLNAVLSQPRELASLLNLTDLPPSFDWREKGAVTPVKNQGMCGSCWAFSTIANIEGVNFVQTGKLLSLSEQELVDCDVDSGDQGCNGGLPANAYQYLIKSGTGLEAEAAYPYTGHASKTCGLSKSDEVVFLSSWKQIPSDEDQMAAALVQYGPLSIGMNAGPMQWYGGGIADPWQFMCNPKSIDHGVTLVGYGEESKKFWIIKNSWGSSWGEKGYYRIIRGRNACGITSMPTTSVIGHSQANIVV